MIRLNKIILSVIALLLGDITHGYAHYQLSDRIFDQEYRQVDYGVLFDSLSNVVFRHSRDEVASYISKLKSYGEDISEPQWILESEILKVRYLNDRSYTSTEESIANLQEILKDAQEENLVNISSRVVFLIFKRYWDIGDYDNAFLYLKELEGLLVKLSNDEFPLLAVYLYTMGESYYIFDDYAKAKHFFRKVEDIPENDFNAHAIMQALNSTGLIYQRYGKLDSSTYCFNRVLSLSKTFENRIWIAIANGNLGKNLYLQGDYYAAMPLLYHDFTTAIEYRDYGLAAGSGTTIAEIYVRLNKPDSAKHFLDSTFVFIHKANQLHRLRLYYPVLAKYESAMGNVANAISYLDSAAFYENNYQKEFSTRLLIRVNQNEYQANLLALKAEETRKRMNWIIGFSFLAVLVLILGTGIFWSRQRARLNRRLANLEFEKKTRELQDAKTQLKQFAERMVENEKVIQLLTKPKKAEQNKELINELRKSRILTEEDWVFFKNRFNTVYSGVIAKLTAEGLTQSEIRYLSLVKLGLSKNEIGTALGVSPNSLRVTWHRIRKKIDFPEGTTPENIVREISVGNS